MNHKMEIKLRTDTITERDSSSFELGPRSSEVLLRETQSRKMIKTFKTFIDSMAGKTFTKTVVQNSSESNYLNGFFSSVFLDLLPSYILQ
jgi:hypothetical protein